ncbi:MAG: hypothetical protein R2726_01155 [Acidimicrobiales bacterium]
MAARAGELEPQRGGEEGEHLVERARGDQGLQGLVERLLAGDGSGPDDHALHVGVVPLGLGADLHPHPLAVDPHEAHQHRDALARPIVELVDELGEGGQSRLDVLGVDQVDGTSADELLGGDAEQLGRRRVRVGDRGVVRDDAVQVGRGLHDGAEQPGGRAAGRVALAHRLGSVPVRGGRRGRPRLRRRPPAPGG